MDVVDLKEWCGMGRLGDGSNTSAVFIVKKSLEPLGNKVGKCLKCLNKASSQWEKVGPS
jgi:hypothetical protein